MGFKGFILAKAFRLGAGQPARKTKNKRVTRAEIAALFAEELGYTQKTTE